MQCQQRRPSQPPRRRPRPPEPATALRRPAPRRPAGPAESASRSGPSTASNRHRHNGIDHQRDAQREQDRARNHPRRITHLLAEGGDPGVAGEGEEQQPGRLQHPADRHRGVQRRAGRGSAAPEPRHRDHHSGQHRQHHDHDHPGQPRRLLDADIVDRGHRDDGRHRDLVRVAPATRRLPDGQRHRRARGGLTDDEPPPGQIAPEGPQPLPAVDVGAARCRVPHGQPGRGQSRCRRPPARRSPARSAARIRRPAPPAPARRRCPRRSSSRARSSPRRKHRGCAAIHPALGASEPMLIGADDTAPDSARRSRRSSHLTH